VYRKGKHWHLLIGWVESSSCSAHAHSFVKKAGFAFVPDEAMMSMQHQVLIRLHHIVPWNKVAFLVASPYKCPHMAQIMSTSRHQLLTGKEKSPSTKANLKIHSPSNGEFHPGARHWNSIDFVCICR